MNFGPGAGTSPPPYAASIGHTQNGSRSDAPSSTSGHQWLVHKANRPLLTAAAVFVFYLVLCSLAYTVAHEDTFYVGMAWFLQIPSTLLYLSLMTRVTLAALDKFNASTSTRGTAVAGIPAFYLLACFSLYMLNEASPLVLLEGINSHTVVCLMCGGAIPFAMMVLGLVTAMVLGAL